MDTTLLTDLTYYRNQRTDGTWTKRMTQAECKALAEAGIPYLRVAVPFMEIPA